MESADAEELQLLQADTEALRRSHPEFAKLVDILSTTYQEDGMPKSIKSQLKQVGSELCFVASKLAS